MNISQIADEITQKILKNIKNKVELPWEKPWDSSYALPFNPASNKQYHGLNAINLMFSDHNDPRYLGFKQLKEKGYKLKKGSKAAFVYVPMIIKKTNELKNDETMITQEETKLIFKQKPVFNGDDIEGLPPLELPRKDPMEIKKGLEEIIAGMNIKVQESLGNPKAFYRLTDDTVYLPDSRVFKSEDLYNKVLAHELAHATGAESRLNRFSLNDISSLNTPKEEITAEMTAVLLSCRLNLKASSKDDESYLTSWGSFLSEKDIKLGILSAIKAEKYMSNFLSIEKELQNNNNINLNGSDTMKATSIMARTSGLEIKAGESKGVIKEGEKGNYELKHGEVYVRAFEHPGKDGKNQKENYENSVIKLSPQEAYKLAGALKTAAETQETKQSFYPIPPHKFTKDGKTTETIIAVLKDTFKDKQGNDRESCILSIGKGKENSKANEKSWVKVNMSKDDALYLSDFTKALAVEQSYENSRKVEKTQAAEMGR